MPGRRRERQWTSCWQAWLRNLAGSQVRQRRFKDSTTSDQTVRRPARSRGPRLLENDPSGSPFCDQHSPSLLDPLGLLLGIGTQRPGRFIAATNPAVPAATVREDFNRGRCLAGRLLGDLVDEFHDLRMTLGGRSSAQTAGNVKFRLHYGHIRTPFITTKFRFVISDCALLGLECQRVLVRSPFGAPFPPQPSGFRCRGRSKRRQACALCA